jgi:hypothetical protein
MKPLFIGAALAAVVSGVSGTAAAGNFKVGDLGEMPSRRICMSIASEVVESYIEKYGGLSTSGNTEDADSWEYYGWNLRPGDIDIVILCTVVASQVNAFYIMHSDSDDADNADIAADRIRRLWDQLN